MENPVSDPVSPYNYEQCIDRVLAGAEAERAAALAIEEHPANAPFQSPALAMPPMEMALITNKIWKNGRTLNVGFLDGSAQQQSLVANRAAVWMQYANLKFNFGTNPASSELRVSFRQAGAWSYIGTDALGIPANQPTINFGFIQPGVIEHEFGHALGCIHEHQNPGGQIPWNVQAVYAYYSGPPNNWDRATIESNIFERYAKELTQFTAWDRGSIMEYPIDRGLVLDSSYAVGWNQALSETDKAFIAKMYPKATTPPGPPVKKRLVIEFDGDYKIVA